MMIFTSRYASKVNKAEGRPSWTKAQIIAGMAAINDPMAGIKFKKKASNPQVPANSTPISANRIHRETPVARLKSVLNAIYRLTFAVIVLKCPRVPSGSGKAASSFRGKPAVSSRIKRTKSKIRNMFVKRLLKSDRP